VPGPRTGCTAEEKRVITAKEGKREGNNNPGPCYAHSKEGEPFPNGRESVRRWRERRLRNVFLSHSTKNTFQSTAHRSRAFSLCFIGSIVNDMIQPIILKNYVAFLSGLSYSPYMNQENRDCINCIRHIVTCLLDKVFDICGLPPELRTRIEQQVDYELEFSLYGGPNGPE
jgi:hypothetical protein